LQPANNTTAYKIVLSPNVLFTIILSVFNSFRYCLIVSMPPALIWFEAVRAPQILHDADRSAFIARRPSQKHAAASTCSGAAYTIGDIGLIQRVLENLVRNAIKFTPAGGEVTISIAERSDSLSVAVSDNGPGIPDDDIPRIFDRFYRSVNGEEARSDSSGLGLAIVKRILDLHGSRITGESKMNAGTRFEFELPLYEQAA
jgi:signal transduction histidine kinase